MNEKNKKIVITSNSFFDKKKQRFEEVDNSLIKKGKCFKNKKGQFDIIFNNQNEGKDLVELKTDEYKLSFNLIGKKEEGNYKLNKKDFRKVHDTKVIIDNVFEDEDLEFEIVNNNEIKELIVINKNNKESYEYEYEIKVENLNAYEDLSNQTIVFKDLKGNIAFMFPKLVMYDSNGNKSNSLKYQLIETKKGKYRLIVSADKKWINDKERTTPIYIDPTIQMESDYYFTLIEQITTNPLQYSKTYNRGSMVDYNHAYLAVHYYLDYIQKIANTTSIKIILDVKVSFEDAASTMFEVYEYFGCYSNVNYNSSELRKINSSQKYMGRDGNVNKYKLVFDICEPFIKNQSTYFFIKKNNTIDYGIIDYKVECSFKCSEGLIKTTPLTDYLFHNYDLLFGKNNLLLNLMGGRLTITTYG